MQHLRASLEHQSSVKDEQILQLQARLNDQHNTSGDVVMSSQSAIDKNEKIAKMESHIEQLTNDLKSKIDLNDELKVKNKVLEVEMEHLKEKLESVKSENDKLSEEFECLKNTLENEKKLYMNERKAAQDSVAAYKDMQTNFEAEQSRTLNMVTAKTTR